MHYVEFSGVTSSQLLYIYQPLLLLTMFKSSQFETRQIRRSEARSFAIHKNDNATGETYWSFLTTGAPINLPSAHYNRRSRNCGCPSQPPRQGANRNFNLAAPLGPALDCVPLGEQRSAGMNYLKKYQIIRCSSMVAPQLTWVLPILMVGVTGEDPRIFTVLQRLNGDILIKMF